MKILIPSLVLLAALGGYGLAGGAAASDCRVSVECTDRGTCIVTCRDANGEIICQREVSCDGPCEKPCPPSDCCVR